MKKMLIIEDNKDILEILLETFSDDFEIQTSEDWEDWLEKATSNQYDIIILDLNLPKIDWIEVCKRIRNSETYWETPIIMLTARMSLESKLEWFDVWADDYLSKPFEIPELIARVSALIKRGEQSQDKDIVKIRDLTVDKRAWKAFRDWADTKLAKKEFELLNYLIEKDWELVSANDILRDVWWDQIWELEFSWTLKYHIFQIRKKAWKDIIKTKSKKWYAINKE